MLVLNVLKKAAIELQKRNTKSVNENWEEEFFNRLAEILEEHFPKGEKCSYCGNKLPCRSKALVLNSYANIIFKELLQKERHDNEILVNTILDTKKRELQDYKQSLKEKMRKIEFNEEENLTKRKKVPEWHLDSPEWEDGYICGVRDVEKKIKSDILKIINKKNE